MNKFRKIIVFILTLVMCLQVTVPAFAANTLGVTYEAIFDKTEIYTSDEDQTITLTIQASEEVGMDSMTCKAAIPEGFTLTAITNETIGLTDVNINLENGKINWWQANFETVNTQTLAVLTYTIPAGVPAGTYQLDFFIEVIGKDFATAWESNVTVPATLTIQEAAEEECDHAAGNYSYENNQDGNTHTVTCEDCGVVIDEVAVHEYVDGMCACGEQKSCEHENTKVVPNSDGTHNIVCTNEACNSFVVEANVECSGGEATCTKLAECSECGAEYGQLAEHTFDKNLKGSLKTEGTCAAEAVYAVKCDNCDAESETLTVKGEKNPENHTGVNHTENAKDATCTEEGYTGDTVCECGVTIASGEKIEKEEHSFTDEQGTLISEGTCKAEAVYAVKCDNCDAESETLTVKGDKVPENHASAEVNYTNNGDTHSATYDCCGAEYVTDEAHTYDETTHMCACEAVETFTLSISTVNEKGEGVQEEIDVPFGAKLADYYLETPDYVSSGLLHEFQSWVAWTWENHDDATMVEYTGDTMPASDVKMYPTYTFTGWVTDENGTIYYVKSAIQKTGKTEIDGAWYYLDPETGIRADGLFIVDGDYYYAKPNGQLVIDDEYYITVLNDVERDGKPVEEGTYTFDAEGRIIWPVGEKNGIYAEDNKLYYYVDGERTYAGLIQYTGALYDENGNVTDADAYQNDYIYVRTSGQLATGRYWVTKNNGVEGIPSASYNFDAQGRMIRTNGLVEEADGIYYYVNGNRTHAGLLKIDGSFYYVKSGGKVVAGCRYWITHTNGYEVTDGIKEGSYEFAEDGKMIIPAPVVLKNGIYEEDDKLMYYVDGKATYAGLIQYTGSLYKEDGSVVEGAYENAWIYVRTSGQLAQNVNYWPTKTNDYMVTTKQYYFDANGVMQDPPM